jgi:hypothetical protein
MARLPSSLLRRAHRFLLEIHAAGDVEALRQLIPEGLSRLISSDRTSLNDASLIWDEEISFPSPFRRGGRVMAMFMHNI